MINQQPITNYCLLLRHPHLLDEIKRRLARCVGEIFFA
jgi:hypothetical protein